MVRAGFIIGLLGIPGLIILPVGIAMMGIGLLLVVLGVVGNTAKAGVGVAKAGVGVGKFVAKSATTKTCPDCRTKMPSAAVVCLACGYREPAVQPAALGPRWAVPNSSAAPAVPAGPVAQAADVAPLA